MYKTSIRQIAISLITQKWPNIIQYSARMPLIFAWGSNTLTSNHHIFASPTIRLRYQSFGIRLNNESQTRIPLRRNLVWLPTVIPKSTNNFKLPSCFLFTVMTRISSFKLPALLLLCHIFDSKASNLEK